MIDRVACAECGAHRDRTRTARCGVCGQEAAVDVPPNLADLDEAIGQARKRLSFLEGARLQLQRTLASSRSEIAN